MVGELPMRADAPLLELTAEAARRFPQSARILTVRARVSREVSVGRRAVTSDPNYLPARVVLADLLADAGDWAEAEKILPNPPKTPAVRDVLTVLARIELAKGDARAALAQAQRASRAPGTDSIEPAAGDPRPLRRVHAVAALAAVALGRYQQAAVHLLDSDPEDPLIRDLLNHPPEELARALRERRAGPAN